VSDRTAAGAVGLVTFDQAADRWRFAPYLDPSLRRCPHLDTAKHVGWANDRQPGGWLAPRGLTPGVDGRFVRDETDPLKVMAPPEFLELCRLYRSSPKAVLQRFMADASAIEDTRAEPRADRYNRTSASATAFAEDYLNLVLGHRINFANLVIYRLLEDESDEDECPILQIKT
jgi:hypothetical protein